MTKSNVVSCCWVSLAIILALGSISQASTIHVPDDYSTIQAGVNAAGIDDTVFVKHGVYYENILIDKRLTLLGERNAVTIIDASESGSTILIRANGVTVSQFSIWNSGGWQDFYRSDAGVRVAYSDSCLIEHCLIAHHPIAGVLLGSTEHTDIKQCVIFDCQYGIAFSMDDLDSLGLGDANQYNEVVSNKIWYCERGIEFYHLVPNHHHTRIEGNFFWMNQGNATICSITCQESEIVNNQFLSCSGRSIRSDHCMCGGEGSRIHHNCFVDGSYSPQALDDGLMNEFWYDTTTNEGNYWSDYTGVDSNGDGIGDTPYVIFDDEFYPREDPFPLMAIDDSDGDGWIDAVDLCPLHYNSEWRDYDHDWVGDECDDCTDYDGDGYSDPGTPSPACPEIDNCRHAYNVNQEDTDGDGVGDSCDFRIESWAGISTDCLRLKVGHNGNVGALGNDSEGGYNMDYMAAGDCDPGAKYYLFDGSPVVCYAADGDTVADRSFWYERSLRMPNWTVPSEFIATDDYEFFCSGAIATADMTIGLDLSWWAPSGEEDCPFIIQALRVYSFDGESHSDITIGEIMDWDIPGDPWVGNNTAGYDSSYNLAYVRGAELDEQGCQSNDARFGGQAVLSVYLNDTCEMTLSERPLSCQIRVNEDHLWQATPGSLYNYLMQPGFESDPDTNDLHTKIVHVSNREILPGDTLTFYTVLATVQEGTVDDLLVVVNRAKSWFQAHIRPVCHCCEGQRGDVDYNAVGPDIADLVYLVTYMFQDGPVPPCMESADIDGVGGEPDIADLVHLVGYMFQEGPPPAECP